MNVRKMIRDKLESEGCRIVEEVGIWTATTPAGELWNFTRPEMVDENGKAISEQPLEPTEDTALD
jgi:hypothetical protein